MAKIQINNELLVNGTCEFSIIKVEDGTVQCHGRLMCHEYIEDIESITTDRYQLNDLDVYKETFSTADYNVLYEFQADDWDIKNTLSYLTAEEKIEIEEGIYSHEADEEPYHKYIVMKKRGQ